MLEPDDKVLSFKQEKSGRKKTGLKEHDVDANELALGIFAEIQENVEADAIIQYTEHDAIEGRVDRQPGTLSDDDQKSDLQLTVIFEGKISRESLAPVCRELRERFGYSTVVAAEMLDVSASDISRAENGKASIEKALHIIEGFGCTITAAGTLELTG